eukprot:m.345046 g.345046  ORF g.345046 m.345046 type:complete len:236 (+) comp25693_c0_seq1:204-911(+)
MFMAVAICAIVDTMLGFEVDQYDGFDANLGCCVSDASEVRPFLTKDECQNQCVWAGAFGPVCTAFNFDTAFGYEDDVCTLHFGTAVTLDYYSDLGCECYTRQIITSRTSTETTSSSSTSTSTSTSQSISSTTQTGTVTVTDTSSSSVTTPTSSVSRVSSTILSETTTITSTTTSRKIEEQTDSSSKGSSKDQRLVWIGIAVGVLAMAVAFALWVKFKPAPPLIEPDAGEMVVIKL